MPLLFAVAVALEIATDLAGIAIGVWDGISGAIHGGVLRAVVMGMLGAYALVRESRWCRVAFAGVEYATALMGLALGFITWSGGNVRFVTVPFGIFTIYSALGILASTGASAKTVASAAEKGI